MDKVLFVVREVKGKREDGMRSVNLVSKKPFGAGFGQKMSVWSSNDKAVKVGDKFLISDMVTEERSWYDEDACEERSCKWISSAKIEKKKD